MTANRIIGVSQHFKQCSFCNRWMRKQSNIDFILKSTVWNFKTREDVIEFLKSKGKLYEVEEGFCNDCSKFANKINEGKK